MFIDLHLHTKYSDGKLNVNDTIKIAKEKNIKILSITDHDSIDGIKEAINVSRSYDMTCISGMELSCRNNNNQVDFPQDISIHILAYNLDYENEALRRYLKEYHLQRKQILMELINELVDNDLDAKYEEISVIAGSQMRIQDIINHINSSFECKEKKEKLIKIAKHYYMKLFEKDCPLDKAIEIIKNAGGMPVLAHPFFSYRDYDVVRNNEYNVSALIDYLYKLGIEGIEVYYPKFNTIQIEWLLKKVLEFNLMITSGSDFHGSPSRKEMIDYEIKEMRDTIEKLLTINRYSI